MKKNIFLMLLLVSCNTSSISTSGPDAVTSLSAFSGAMPTAIAISSPTSTSTLKTASKEISPTSASSVKIDRLLSLLSSGTSLGDCAVDLSLVQAHNASCYGPGLTYTDFDGNLGVNGNLPTGDLGLWSEKEGATDEACASAQFNSRTAEASSFADLGIFSMASLMCIAEATAQTLPDVGDTLTLTTDAVGLIEINSMPLNVTLAEISREADGVDGNPVYVAVITGDIADTSYTIRLKHHDTASDSSTYEGKFSILIQKSDGNKPLNCNSSDETGQTDAISLLYEKTTGSNVGYELKYANFCGTGGDPFTAASAPDHTVDFSEKLNHGTNEKGWANNANYLVASYDKDTLAGDYVYAWQAGYMDGNARSIQMKISQLAAVKSGVAYFGYTNDIVDMSFALDGMICNWAGPAPNRVMESTKLQYQSMLSNTGVFEPVTSDILYDPTNTCESTSASYRIQNNGGSLVFDYFADSTTEDLHDLSEYTTTMGTLPTAPTDVDL